MRTVVVLCATLLLFAEVACWRFAWQDIDEAKLAILEPPYARRPDAPFLAKM
jgi:hypothetical protein